ncbi:MAG TPA: sugar transferase [Candidatus Babeliales bacterium]|nr:sugar transferase [Candidatus Babeliales bacterium]
MSKTRLTGERWVASDEKRALDILLASSLIPAAAPIGGLALAASRMMDGSNPLVYQQRIGRGLEPFLIRKIRSMEPIEPSREIHRTDSELTKLGRLIRPLAIDEIPQLYNMIEGSMSMFGPRAYPQETMDGMEAHLPRDIYEEWLYVYMTSRPGGLSSYNIRARAVIDLENTAKLKALLDIADFNNASLSYDTKLLRSAALMGLSVIKNKLKQSI